MKHSRVFAVLLVGSLVSRSGAQATQPPSAQRVQAIQSDPRVVRADSLFNARNFRLAASQYETTAQVMELDPRSHYRWGVSLSNLGDYARAAQQFDLAAISGNPVVLLAAGSAHGRLGHSSEAFDYLNRSIARGFSSEQLFVADSGFMKLSADPRYGAARKQLRDAFTPCVNRPASRQFDFWVGDWTVTGLAGQQAGTSSVQKILDECVLFENWTDAQGGHGKSLNAYNAQLNRWQQFWVDQYGVVTEYRDSEWVGKSLQYVASGVSPQGSPVLLRMTFTPVDSVTVRQHGETSTDAGKTWATTYDLSYHRKK